MNKDCKIYISYCTEDQISEYNLKETENIMLFNVFDESLPNNINNMNCHYSELVIAYYVWKNNLKSDYVCIWDHRRFLTHINYDELDNDKIQSYYSVSVDLTPFEYMIHEGINEYIIWEFIKYMIEVKGIDHDTIIDKIFNKPWDTLWFHSCFNCNWKVFTDLCEFMFGFVDYMIPNGKHNDYNSVQTFIKDMKCSIMHIRSLCKDGEIIDYGRIESEDRDIGNIYEMLLPLYVDLVWNGHFSEFENLKIGVEINEYDENNIINRIGKWIHKNTWTGCRVFYVKVNNDDLGNKLKNMLETIDLYYISCNGIRVVYEFDEDDVIVINLNEYIDVESPISIENKNIKCFDNE